MSAKRKGVPKGGKKKKHPGTRSTGPLPSLGDIIARAASLGQLRIFDRGGKLILELCGEVELETTREGMREAYRKEVMRTGKTMVDILREWFHSETDPGVREQVSDLLAHASEHPELGGVPIPSPKVH